MQIDVRFPCDDGHSMGGVLTIPSTREGQPRPALLLVYEMFGMVPEMRRVARDLASEGYVVLIPDIFDRAPKPICIVRAIRAIAQQKGKPLDDLEAARRWLAARPEVDDQRMGVVGFCLGGGFALVLAMSGRYKVAAPFYGAVPDEMPRSCPVVASYGGRDEPWSPGVPKLRRHLETLGVPHDVKVYPDAGHSFYTATPGGMLGYFAARSPLHAGHHPESARDARGRMVAFLHEHLDGSSPNDAA